MTTTQEGPAMTNTLDPHELPCPTCSSPVRVAGMHDGSRLHRMNVDPYDAACPCCYLGHPHTLAAHQLATT